MRTISLLLGLLCTLAAAAALAQSEPAYRAQILQKGIFEAETVGQPSADGLWRVQNARLIEATSNIPLRRNLRFGLKYVLIASSTDRRQVLIELVTRFPAPGLTTPNSSVPQLESRRHLEIPTGAVRFRNFQFVEDEELIPGKWVFEFWVGGRKIAEEVFCVFEPRERHPTAPPCGDLGNRPGV